MGPFSSVLSLEPSSVSLFIAIVKIIFIASTSCSSLDQLNALGTGSQTNNSNGDLDKMLKNLVYLMDDESPVYSTNLNKTIELAQRLWENRQRDIENLWNESSSASPKSPLGTAHAFHAPNSHSMTLANTSIILELVSRELMINSNYTPRAKRHIFTTSSKITPYLPAQEYMSTCGVMEENFPCAPASPYRSYSGWCNNLANPIWGKSVRAFDRMLPAQYDDGISVPRSRSKVDGKALPSPRYISRLVHVDVSHLSHKHTLMFMQYAQFLDHDVTFTPVHKGPSETILNCRPCSSRITVHPECWPIPVPNTDGYYPSDKEQYCIPFVRSLPGQEKLGPREQINQNSAYLDSSHIYGESYCKAMSLRTGGGQLNVTDMGTDGKHLMPQITQMKECKSPSGYCFYAGDPRASEQPALASVHTIFLREHNRIAKELYAVNPHWHDEKLYQQSRRIVTAINQHIIYNEFLPRLLGPTIIHAYGLQLQSEGYYDSYDSNCQPTALNEFATAAFRFGHSLIRPMVPRMDRKWNGMKNGNIPLRDGFFNSDMLYKSLMVDEIIRGLLAEPMEQMDPFISKEITNHLFEDNAKSFSGMDLVALNLQRGRDHGLQGYNAYREVCDLKRAYTWSDLTSEIPEEVIQRLQLVYAHPDDIDLFTGSIVELPVNGGILGPTMSCIIGNQFRRLRKCDRFWYETNDPLIRFTPAQLNEIRKITLSKVLCDNFDEHDGLIQKHAFDGPHNYLNPRLPCTRLPTLHLSAWAETPAPQTHCTIGGKVVSVGEGVIPTPCASCTCTPEGPKCNSLRITSCEKLIEETGLENASKDPNCRAQCGQHFRSYEGTRWTPTSSSKNTVMFNIINGVRYN